jgi:glycosyltransferase involved in cell wall biosynthesis
VKILFLEPFFGGSHQDFATGFSMHSRHEVTLLTLPPEDWRWRMRSGSLDFLQNIEQLETFDRVFATDMMDVAQFKALAGPDCPPVVLYFHENQMSYPLSSRAKQRKPDIDAGWININSALSANQIWFNSHFHLTAFLKGVQRLIKQMPAPRPKKIVDKIHKKARVVYPGCRFPSTPDSLPPGTEEPPLIIWNHRWEYDKQPELFFKVLVQLKQRGILFSLALLGERYERYPDVFDQARKSLSKEIVAFGYEPSRKSYEIWLAKGRVVVSTAIQENFGISVVEAVRFGCFPLLPHRLSYPELMPETCHDDIFFHTENQLLEKLTYHLQPARACVAERSALSQHMQKFSWESQAPFFDHLLETMAGP